MWRMVSPCAAWTRCRNGGEITGADAAYWRDRRALAILRAPRSLPSIPPCAAVRPAYCSAPRPRCRTPQAKSSIQGALICDPLALGRMAEYAQAWCCRCGHQEKDLIRMIHHAWSRHLPVAPARAWNAGHLIIVSPGRDMAPCSDWMLAWVPAGYPPAALARFLEQEWLLRRTGDCATIAPAAGWHPLPFDRPVASSAETVLGRRADLVLEASGGHVIDVRHVCPAPSPPPDACGSAAVLAETTPLPGFRFVSADRMRAETLHVRTDDATGACRGWIGPCAAA